MNPSAPLPRPLVSDSLGSLGFLVPRVDDDAATTLLGAIADYYAGGGTVDIIVFFEDPGKPRSTPMCALMNLTEVYDFAGIAVATTGRTAATLLTCPGPRRRLLWLHAADWSEAGDSKNRTYGENLAVYADPRLELIAVDPWLALLATTCWNRPVGWLAAGDLEGLLERLTTS